MADLFGKALLEYYHGQATEDIITATSISDDDILPLSYLFRDYSEMPLLERSALQHCKGSILDVGCGAGSHSLWLQQQEHKVTAIDISEGATAVARLRGVQHVQHCNVSTISEATYDTILMLMNGTGIFETVANTPKYLQHLKTILKPDGQILIDSSDLQYMYDRNEDGSIWVPANRYYGELEFTMHYKNETTDAFPWLYLDERLFQELAVANGFKFEILARGENFDYLAKLTLE